MAAPKTLMIPAGTYPPYGCERLPSIVFKERGGFSISWSGAQTGILLGSLRFAVNMASSDPAYNKGWVQPWQPFWVGANPPQPTGFGQPYGPLHAQVTWTVLIANADPLIPYPFTYTLVGQ